MIPTFRFITLLSQYFEIGQILHLKSEIRNLQLDSVQSDISDFGFEMQDLSNFKISYFPVHAALIAARLTSWPRRYTLSIFRVFAMLSRGFALSTTKSALCPARPYRVDRASMSRPPGASMRQSPQPVSCPPLPARPLPRWRASPSFARDLPRSHCQGRSARPPRGVSSGCEPAGPTTRACWRALQAFCSKTVFPGAQFHREE